MSIRVVTPGWRFHDTNGVGAAWRTDYRTWWQTQPTAPQVSYTVNTEAAASNDVNVNAECATVSFTANQPTVTTSNLVATNVASNYDNADAASYTSASFTPTANSVLLVWHFLAATTTAGTPTVSDSTSLTWNTILTDLDGGRSAGMFWAQVGGSPVAMTVTFNGTGGDGTWTGCGWFVIQITGASATPAVQSKLIGGDGTTSNAPTQTLDGAIGAAGNRVFSFWQIRISEAITERTNWTELGGHNSTAPNSGIEAQWRNDGTNETTFGATWATSVRYIGMGVEVQLAVAGGDVNVSAGNATLTFTANQPTAGISPSAGNATIAATANQASLSIKPSAAGDGSNVWFFGQDNATASIKPNAGNAAVTFTANNPTVTTGGDTNVFPTAAAVTFTTNQPTASVAPSAGNATVAFTANQVTSSVKPSAGVAAVTFTVNAPTSSIKPSAGNAAVTFTANQPTVTVGGDLNVAADNATITVTANQPSISVKVNAGVAAVTVTANNATTTKAISAQAGVASVTFTVNQTAVAAAVTAAVALVVFTANDPTTAGTSIIGTVTLTMTSNDCQLSMGSNGCDLGGMVSTGAPLVMVGQSSTLTAVSPGAALTMEPT